MVNEQLLYVVGAIAAFCGLWCLLRLKIGRGPIIVTAASPLLPIKSRSPSAIEKWYMSHCRPHVFGIHALLNVGFASTACANDVACRALRNTLHSFPRFLMQIHGSQMSFLSPSKVSVVEAVTVIPVQGLKRWPSDWPEQSVFSFDGQFLFHVFLYIDSTASKCLLGVIVHHVVADGLSLSEFLVHLCEEVRRVGQRSLPSGSKDDVTHVTDVMRITRPIEELIDVRPRIIQLLRALLPSLSTASQLSSLQLADGRSAEIHFSRLKNMDPLFINVDSDWFCSLQKTLRLHGASVTSLLIVCAELALRRLLSLHKLDDSGQIVVTVPMSLRPAVVDRWGTSILGSPMSGLAICGHTVIAHPSLEDPWLRAAAIREGFRDAPTAGRHKIGQIGMLSFDQLRAWVLRNMYQRPAARTSDIEVSNLGMVDAPETVDKLYFVQGAHFDGPMFTISVATVHDRMVMSVTAPSPVITADTLAEYVEVLVEELVRASGLPEDAVHLGVSL